MPQLKPEDTTMIGLTLFNQLCQLARIANASLDNPLSDEQVIGGKKFLNIHVAEIL